MASEMSNYQCPACMGPMHFAGASGKLECDYCGSSYSVEEVEKMMAAANEGAVQATADAQAKPDEWAMAAQSWDGEGMKGYSCPGCGAELVCDETTAATSCPYCGSTTIVPAQFEGMLQPEFVVPFKLDKNHAIAKLKEHYKGKTLLPKSFTDGNHIDEIKGVYVPFWLYDGVASGGAVYDAEKDHVERTATEEITRTEHFIVRRSGSVAFEKIPADASSKMPDDLMDSIEPYDYSEMKPFSKAYMAGYLADKYDETAEDNAPRVEERAKNTLETMLNETVTGYSRHSVKTSNSNIRQGKVSYAMMPVWLLSTNWNGQNFLFAMNGQTGKMVGDLPADMGKFWKIMIGWFLGLEVLMGIITMFSEGDMTMGGMVFKFGIIPILICAIIGMVLKGQLKSVFKATESRQYATGQGLTLTLQTDTYVNTTVTRRKLEQNNGNS